MISQTQMYNYKAIHATQDYKTHSLLFSSLPFHIKMVKQMV